ALAFGLAVVIAGGWRGLRALLALTLTVAVVIRILVPLLVQGVPPIPVAVVLATGITVLTIGLTEGFSRVSVAAILGTAGALALTALLAAATIAVTGFSNAIGSDLIYLQTAPGVGLDLRGLLLAAFMFGAIGVLDDVTVTQATAVEELVKHGRLGGRGLFASAFNVGRSHIAATVNTLFLAYLGASLPLIVLFVVSRQPTTLILNGELVAIEIVRTLVGSLGIVAAVPFTTLIAVWLTRDSGLAHEKRDTTAARRMEQRLRRPAVALVTGLAAIGLLTAGVAAAMTPLTVAPPRSAVVPDQFGGTPPPSAGPPLESPDPTVVDVPNGDPPIVQVGAAMPVVDGASALGSVTVLQHRTDEAADGTRLFVQIRYRAEQSFDVRVEAWEVVNLDGEAAVARPSSADPALAPATLEAGQTATGWLEFEVGADPADLFLDYQEPGGSTLFSVALF
ncbi:MAG TPA: YibE/F family protein, partial [Candidatus Limnocylindrales bacterium]|nr:YibE/F family protein [Candidatus Limnocylindrales bacterium]